MSTNLALQSFLEEASTRLPPRRLFLLRRVVSSLSDYLQREGQPAGWLNSLPRFLQAVERESGPLLHRAAVLVCRRLERWVRRRSCPGRLRLAGFCPGNRSWRALRRSQKN